jgi:hypothetical protein
VAGGVAAWIATPHLAPAGWIVWEAEAPWRGPAPDAREWPRPPAAGERATVRDGRLVVASRAPAAARLLAERLSTERLLDPRATDERREGLRAAAAAELVEGPLPALAPGAEAAALLRGRARAMRAVAGDDPALASGRRREAPDGAAPDAGEPPVGTALAAAWGAVEEAAAASDPARIAGALSAVALAEHAWLEREAAASPPGAAGLAARWSAYGHRRADALDAMATALETGLTPLQRELVDLTSPARAIELAPGVPDPSRAARTAGAVPAVSPARPSRLARAAVAGAGALAGLIAGLGLAAPILVLGRRRRGPGDLAAAAPDLTRAWLHLACGPGRRDVARVAIELAARATARGDRVLVIDAGRGLALHRAFGAEARLGLVDCLEDQMPVLGLCQHGGVPGLFFLAWGEPRRRAVWTQLDRVLEEARPHFGRLILALAEGTPPEVGSVLAGRLMEGWWAGPGLRHHRRGLDTLESRIGIRFGDIDLRDAPKASLEALRGRRAALVAGPPVPGAAAPGEIHPALEPAAPTPPVAAAVLDCDLQVRERLRFLAWTRRVQAESRTQTPEPARRD